MKCFYLLFIFLFVSCGVDKLSTTAAKNTTSSLATNVSSSTTSCLCTSDYAPVCGSSSNEKKDYDNACLAKCFGSDTYVSGHCACDNSRTVCGNDGKDYPECDAVSAGITITKYIPCGASSI